jgi:hypothetical protein
MLKLLQLVRLMYAFYTRLQVSTFSLQMCLMRQPLWSSGQSSWLQIQRFGYGSRRYQIFWEVLGLERGPLSLVSTIEELLGRNNSGSGLESREYSHREPSRWPRGTIYPQKLALTFFDKRLSLGRYISLADSGHGDYYLLFTLFMYLMNNFADAYPPSKIPHFQDEFRVIGTFKQSR